MTNFITDSFTSATAVNLTAHTPEVGGSWVISQYTIDSGRTSFTVGASTGTVVFNEGGAIDILYVNATPPAADYTVSATVQVAATGDYAGVVARGTVAAASIDAYVAYLNAGTITLVRYGGSGTTTLGTSAAGAYTTNTNYLLALTCQGYSLIVKLDGVTVVTATDSEFATAGKAGLFASNATYTSVSADTVVVVATATTLSGPSAGATGSASSDFTVGANGDITGTVVVTPSDAAGGGTFSPTTVSISSATPTGTFTYTPASDGAKSISTTNNGGLTNPATVSYTASTAGSLVTLTDLTNLRVYQRISGASSVTVSGTYTNSPGTIQARIVLDGTSTEVVTWITIVASPAGGVFSGSISVPQGGWYNIQVRASTNTAAPANGSNKWGVGDIYVAAGQSNAAKMFDVGAVAPSNTTCQYTTGWTANAGAGACTFANALTAALGVPVAMIKAAIGGEGLCTSTAAAAGSWDNTATDPYTTWLSRVTSVGGKIAGVLWLQGEWDGSNNVAKQLYKDTLANLLATMRAATGQPSLPLFIAPLTRYTVASYAGWDNVQDAFMESFSASVVKTCDTWDLPSDDGLHYNAAGQTILGNRMALAVRKYHGQAVESLGPTLNSIQASGTKAYLTFAHISGSDLSPATGITGLTFTDNAVAVVPTSVVRQSSTVVEATFSAPLTGPIYAAVAVGTNPNAAAPLKDSAGLPAQRTATSGVLGTMIIKSVGLLLTMDGSTPAVNLTGLKWAFFDNATPDLFGAPSASGTTGTTDASGNFLVSVPWSTLSNAGIGWLVVTDSDGTTTQTPAHKAFSGPVAVA